MRENAFSRGRTYIQWTGLLCVWLWHDDVIKCKHFPRYWPFVRGIHRSPVNSPHQGQWLGSLMFFFYLRLNKRLSIQSWGWWLETPSCPLWRHCNEIIFIYRSHYYGPALTFWSSPGYGLNVFALCDAYRRHFPCRIYNIWNEGWYIIDDI